MWQCIQAAAVQAEHSLQLKCVLAREGRNLNGPKICRLTVLENNLHPQPTLTSLLLLFFFNDQKDFPFVVF